MSTILEQLRIDYRNDTNGSYLVITSQQETEVLQHQVNMIEKQTPASVLPLQVRQKDNQKHFFYTITSKQKLSTMLERRKISRSDFIRITESLCTLLSGCGNYFLTDSHFLVHSDYIYVDPATWDIQLVYLPFTLQEPQLMEDVKVLVEQLMTKVDLQDSQDSGMFHKLFVYLKEDSFNPCQLQEIIRSDLKAAGEPAPAPGPSPVSSEPGPASPVSAAPRVAPIPVSTPPFPEPAQEPMANPWETPVFKEEQAAPVTVHRGYPPKIKLIAGLVQILLILIAALLVMETNLLVDEATGQLDIVTLAGVLLVLGVVDFFVLRALLNPSNKVEITSQKKVKAAKEPKEKKKKPKKTPASASQPPPLPSTPPAPAPPAPPSAPAAPAPADPVTMNKREAVSPAPAFTPPGAFQPSADLDGTQPAEDFQEGTVMLEEEEAGPREAYLVSKEGGQVKRQVIVTPIFLIGKISDQVDYVVDSKAVSRIHAQIVYEEGTYALMDLNSKNGSFINGTRIDSNQQHPLHNGDEIKLADKLFTVELPG